MKYNQKGFTIMATVFILVVLALAGVYLLKIGIGQQQIVNYELLTARARLANISAYELFAKDQHQMVCQDKSYHFGRQEKALSGFEVKITCVQTISYPLDAPRFIAWQLKATTTYGHIGDREYVNHEGTRWHIINKGAS